MRRPDAGALAAWLDACASHRVRLPGEQVGSGLALPLLQRISTQFACDQDRTCRVRIGDLYERLYRENITDGLILAEHAESYRDEYNTVRPHEAIAWNRPADVHRGLADPAIPNFDRPDFLPSA